MSEDLPPITDASLDPRRAGRGLFYASLFVSAAWLGAGSAYTLATIGPEAALALPPIDKAAVVGGLILPALMLSIAGLAFREGARARASALRVAMAAERLLNPSPDAAFEAKSLGRALRQEIALFDRAAQDAVTRVSTLSGGIGEQAALLERTAGSVMDATHKLSEALAGERGALTQTGAALEAHATAIGEALGRRARVIAEAANAADEEARAAEERLKERANNLSAISETFARSSSGLKDASQRALEAHQGLEHTVSSMLDSLTTASHLTDASRQAAEKASAAALVAAQSLREATSSSLDEARRILDVLRSEHAQTSRIGEEGVQKLRSAALEAREAAEMARNVLEQHGQELETRLTALMDRAQGALNQLEGRIVQGQPASGPARSLGVAAGASFPTARAPLADPPEGSGARISAGQAMAPPQGFQGAQGQQAARPDPTGIPRGLDPRDLPMFADEDSVLAGAPAGREGTGRANGAGPAGAAQAASRRPLAPNASPMAGGAGARGAPDDGWSWNDIFSGMTGPSPGPNPGPNPGPSAGAGAAGVASKGSLNNGNLGNGQGNGQGQGARMAPSAGNPRQALPASGPRGTDFAPVDPTRFFAQAGLDLSGAFSPLQLDRLAAQTRRGADARRRAVREAAPDMVRRLREFWVSRPDIRRQAEDWAIGTLDSFEQEFDSNRGVVATPQGKAFLLVDAALG